MCVHQTTRRWDCDSGLCSWTHTGYRILILMSYSFMLQLHQNCGLWTVLCGLTTPHTPETAGAVLPVSVRLVRRRPSTVVCRSSTIAVACEEQQHNYMRLAGRRGVRGLCGSGRVT